MTAASVLIMAEIKSLPVDITALVSFFGIKVVSYEDCAAVYHKSLEQLYREGRFGFSFCEDEEYVIALNENACGERRRRWTLAHELGHCMLGHLQSTAHSVAQEREADAFAAEILAPLTVLHFCSISSAQELSAVCGLSAQAGEIRFRELSLLRKTTADCCRKNTYLGKEQNSTGIITSAEQLSLFTTFEPFVTRYIYEKVQRERFLAGGRGAV